MWVRPLADCDADAGGKAHGLARLIRAGLPVPHGFAIVPGALVHALGEATIDLPSEGELLEELIRNAGHELDALARRIEQVELPGDLVAEVESAVAALGEATFAVRSSSVIEDRAEGSGAGVFASFVDVPRDELWRAIRGVWTSVVAPLAASYARLAPSQRTRAQELAVIVQRFVRGDRLTVYTRPAGEPSRDEVWIQRVASDHAERLSGNAATNAPSLDAKDANTGSSSLTKTARGGVEPIVELAMRAETAIAASAGADVELVDDRGSLWIVQARPVVHPVRRRRVPPPPIILAPLQDGRVWTQDIAHNPDPLSPAQTGLVERVERAGVAAWSMRVCAGYLYTTPCDEPALPEIRDVRDLATRAHAIQREALDALGIADLSAIPAPQRSLAEWLDRYVAFYAIWANELVPLIRAGRTRLAPEHLSGARPSAVEHVLFAVARGEITEAAALLELGALSTAWDVAVPTLRERPSLLQAAIERARVAIRRMPSGANDAGDPIGRAAADLAERDDRIYAAAQAFIRWALQARARSLAIDPENIFWLPLEEVVAATSLDRDDAHRRASAARAAAARAADWEMPIVVGGSPPEPGPAPPALVGTGTGGRVTGRVVHLPSLASIVTVGHGEVIVTRAITPALAVIVMGCAAIVSETGGLLDHGAAIARELGIPCVVGCRDAWSLLYDGMIVTVDGDAGTVTR